MPVTWPVQQTIDIGDGVVAIIQGEGEAGVSNAGLVVDGDRALVVDTMMFADMATGLRAALDARSARPDVVVNTHHHIDHIGGNAVFSDARLVAHPEAVHMIERSGHPVPIYEAFMPAFKGEFEKVEVVTPDGATALDDLAGGAQLLPYAPAHTPGDLAVWLDDQRILFTGDLCFFGVTPLALQGLVSAWIDALDALIALEPDVVVPGHGPVGTAADIVVVRDHLVRLRDHGRAAVESGASLDDALAEFDAGPVSEWIEGERTLVNLERAMQEARGEIRRGDLDAVPPSFGRLLQ